MSAIFVSYAGNDRARVAPLVHALEADGLQLWWDRDIDFGQSFHTVIEQALAAAPCVIVVWTRESVQSEWVMNEASEARKRGCLIPVLLDPVAPPLEFRHLQGADLTAWNGDPADQSFAGLRKALISMLGRDEARLPTNLPVQPIRVWWQTWPGRMLGAGGLLIGISVLLFTLRLGRVTDGSVDRGTPSPATVGPAEQTAELNKASENNSSSQQNRVGSTPSASTAAPVSERTNLLDTDAGAQLITTNQGVEDRWKILFTASTATANLYANDYAILALPGEKEVRFDTVAVFVDQLFASLSVKELARYVSSTSPDGPFAKAAQITVPNYRNLQNPFHEVHIAPAHARFIKLQILSFHLTVGTGYVGSIRLYASPATEQISR